MLRKRFCELFEIDAPVLQAAFCPATAPDLVAAVSGAGGLGSLGALLASAQEASEQIDRAMALTDRPFVVNQVVPALDADAFEATLEARPAGVSFALGDPGDLVERVHPCRSEGDPSRFTVTQAQEPAGRGVDVVIGKGARREGMGWLRGGRDGARASGRGCGQPDSNSKRHDGGLHRAR